LQPGTWSGTTKGFVAFKPCSLVTGQLDAAARFTLHLAGKDARSRKPMPKLGDGYLFPELGMTRSWIQDGFMNAWKESQAVHEIAINEEVRRAIAQLHGGRVASADPDEELADRLDDARACRHHLL